MRPHRTDIGSLIFGVLFLGVAGWWLLAQVTDFAIGLGALGWLIAAGLVVAGVLGVLAALRPAKATGSEHRSERSEWGADQHSKPAEPGGE